LGGDIRYHHRVGSERASEKARESPSGARVDLKRAAPVKRESLVAKLASYYGPTSEMTTAVTTRNYR